jgi:16S rRNA (guanine966-N2)-methyltransferase
MRIIAGSRRGAKLTKLDAVNIRPTADRVRESLFNILDSGKFGLALQGALVIDAFAGTGALGLEALSRGAASAYFIEQSADALLVLRANVKKLDMHSHSQIIAGDATSLTHWQHAPATILFADAPYHTGGGQKTAISLQSLGGLAAGAIVILETHKSETIDHGQLAAAFLTLDDTRIYGKTALHFFRTSG